MTQPSNHRVGRALDLDVWPAQTSALEQLADTVAGQFEQARTAELDRWAATLNDLQVVNRRIRTLTWTVCVLAALAAITALLLIAMWVQR